MYPYIGIGIRLYLESAQTHHQVTSFPWYISTASFSNFKKSHLTINLPKFHFLIFQLQSNRFAALCELPRTQNKATSSNRKHRRFRRCRLVRNRHKISVFSMRTGTVFNFVILTKWIRDIYIIIPMCCVHIQSLVFTHDIFILFIRI